MSEKKLFQLIKPKEKITPEFKKALDEMYAEILAGDSDFVMICGGTGSPIGYLTNLDVAGCNLILDQVKLHGLMPDGMDV